MYMCVCVCVCLYVPVAVCDEDLWWELDGSGRKRCELSMVYAVLILYYYVYTHNTTLSDPRHHLACVYLCVNNYCHKNMHVHVI